LTRARVVCAEGDLGENLEAAVRSVLTARRDASELGSDVAEMRERILREHGVDDIWSVKHIPGGIVDIEFFAQYLQLKYAAETPEILAGDTAAAFAVAGEKGLIETDVASELVNATILWRNLQGILRLTVEGGFSEDGAAVALKWVITRACGAVDFETLKQTIETTAAKSAALCQAFFGIPKN